MERLQEGESQGDDIHEDGGREGVGEGNANSLLTACRTVTRYL